MVYTTDELRTKIKENGWALRELPIRTGGAQSGQLRGWKLIAAKGERSLTLEGNTLDSALTAVCKTLGLIGW